MNFTQCFPLVWPLTFLLLALIIIRKIGDDMRPVFVGVVGGVAQNAKQYSLMYAMGALYATGASLQALGEVATQFEWVYVAAFAKVAQPGVIAIIAYVTKPPAITQVTPEPSTLSTEPIK